jgi:hypothetical protein
MKTLISILVGVAIFIGVFYLDGMFINWVVAPLVGVIRYIIKIVLWLLTFSFTLWLATFLGGMAGFLVDKLLNKNK